MSVVTAAGPILRVTPMTVLPDIAPAQSRYQALGFERVETGDAGCVGMRAGQTAVILASVDFMNGDFDAVHTRRLAGETIPYIYVASVDQARSRLSSAAVVLQDAVTRGGTRELLVDDCGDLFVLAEKVV